MAKNFGLDPSVFDKLSQKGDESDNSVSSLRHCKKKNIYTVNRKVSLLRGRT